MRRRRVTRRSHLRRAIALLRHSTIPFVFRHRIRFSLLVLSVSLGVATIAATRVIVDSAVESVARAAAPSASTTDLRVANGFAGVPEQLLEVVRAQDGVADAQAIILGQAVLRETPIALVGLDLLGGDRIHLDDGIRDNPDFRVCQESDFLLRSNAIAIPSELAHDWGVELCSTIRGELRSGIKELFVAGVFAPNLVGAGFDSDFVIMDLPRAQLLLERASLVDAIDVRLDRDAIDVNGASSRIEMLVGNYGTVIWSGSESPEIRNMLFNIRLILGVAGSLALVVGALIIFNVMSMSASNRKPVLDMMVALGATPRSLLALMAMESLLIGLLSSSLGIAIGLAIAKLASSVFRGAIAALYLPLQSSVFTVTNETIAIGYGCGVLLTLCAAVSPVRSASDIGSGLRVTSPSVSRAAKSARYAKFGAGLLTVGVLSRSLQLRELDAEVLGGLVTVGACLVFLGFGLLIPKLLQWARKPVSRILGRSSCIQLSIAWRTVTADPTRSAVAIVSIMAGVSYFLMTVGTVGSLREGVLSWLRSTQQSEIVVASRGDVGFLPSSRAIPGAVESRLASIQGISSVEAYRLVAQPFLDRWAVVVARDSDGLTDPDRYLIKAGNITSHDQGLRSGTHAIISETLAVKHGLDPGEILEVRSPSGRVRLEVAAVAIDYNSDLGSIIVSKDRFARLWLDDSANAYHVWTSKGYEPQEVIARIESTLGGEFGVSAQAIEDVILAAEEIVDSAFYAGYALVFVAVVVVVASIMSFFMIAAGERESEFHLMREIGATSHQVARLLRSESLIIGIVGGTSGCIAGTYIARSVVTDSVRIGGGMQLDFVLPWPIIGTALLAAAAVSVAASALPISHIASLPYRRESQRE